MKTHSPDGSSLSLQPASASAPLVDVMVGLDRYVALDVLLSVDLVIIDRSLSLLTRVLI